MANVLPIETISEIRVALERGDGVRAIARKYGISTNTVARYRREGVLCACGEPLHTGLCKEKHAQSLGLISYKRRMRGINDNYRKPPPRSRQRERTAKLLFVFGFAPDWQDRAKRLPESEYYGVMGEVERVTRNVRLEYRAEVRQEMALACFEGRLMRDEIAAYVGKFTMFEMMRYQGHRISRYVSIFEPITTGGGGRTNGKELTFIDLMVQEITDEDDIWTWSACRFAGAARLCRSEVSQGGPPTGNLRDYA